MLLPGLQKDTEMKWTEDRWGYHHLVISDGLIRASVGWDSMIPKGTPTGFKVAIGVFRYRRVFDDLQKAKDFTEKEIRKLIKKAQLEVEE